MHSDANLPHANFLQVLRKAGFPPPTSLQEKLAPLILKGRDVIVEAGGADSATTVILSLILGLRGAGLAPHALLLMPSRDDVGKVAQAVVRFTRVLRDVPAFVPLGEIDDVRREQRRLEKGSTIVAGTTERVIDHVRRGSLSFADLAMVAVLEPGGEGRADFARDVQFIFARLTERHQTVLFSSLPPGQENELAALLRHPVVLSMIPSGGAPAPQPREHLLFETGHGDKVQALARVLLGRNVPKALVLCSPRGDPRRIVEALRLRLLRAAAPQQERGRSPRGTRDRTAILSADVVVTTAAAPEDFSPSHVIYLDPPPAGRSARWTSNVIVLVDRARDREISRFQEAIGVSLKKENLPTDDEVVTGSIDRILRNLKDEKDMTELARLRSRIRRQVPLLQRALFMAYLLRSLLPPRQEPAVGPPEGAGRAQSAERREALRQGQARGRFGRGVEAPRTEKPVLVGAPGQEFIQLFVSIGRNRRVYARELTELFTEKLRLGAGELGSVRVFDKYSFVDIKAARADEAITKLSGSEVKGRTITVNYAKKKEEKGER